jgi:hypothetical protein
MPSSFICSSYPTGGSKYDPANLFYYFIHTV